MVSHVDRIMPRIEAVVRPILIAGLPDHVTVVTWTPDIDHRTGAPSIPEADLAGYPIVKIRRFGGLGNQKRPDSLDRPVIELTAFSTATDTHYVGNSGTADLLLDAQHLIFQAVRYQTIVEGAGYLHSWFQTMGPTQMDSPFEDTWRWQSLIQLGLRPLRQR